MAQLIGTNQVKLNNGQVKLVKDGEWYDGRRFLGGQLLGVNEYEPGKFVGAEVRAQSAAAQGVSPEQFDTYLTGEMQKTNTGGGVLAGNASRNNIGVPGMDGGGGDPGMTGSFSAPTTINLQNIYDKAFQDAGINDLVGKADAIQMQIDQRLAALNEAKAFINENPFNAEATRTGKIQKLQMDAENDINTWNGQKALIQEQINSAKTDVQTKLNLATKQFDINSAAATQALNQFNTLLSSGALDNAAGGDIAQFAAATGLPTSFINSAVKASQKKNTETKLIESTDDNGNVTVSLVQIKDGQLSVVGKQSLGKISGSKSSGGASQSQLKSQAIGQTAQIFDSLANSYGHVSPADWARVRSAALQSGLTAQEFNSNFSSYTDPNRADFNSSYGFDIKSRGANQYQILNQGS